MNRYYQDCYGNMSLLSIALISMDKLSVDPLSVDKRTLFRRISLSKITHTSSARPILLTRALSRVFSAMVFSAKALATLATFSLLMSASADDAAIKNVEIKSLGNNNYQISVTLLHADTGWDHYANRWDVLDEDGNVLGTRVLAHPHVNEQPFTRSLTVEIPPDVTTVTIVAADSVHGDNEKTVDVMVPGTQ